MDTNDSTTPPDDVLRLLSRLGVRLRAPLSEQKRAELLASLLAARSAERSTARSASSISDRRASSPASPVGPGHSAGAGVRPASRLPWRRGARRRGTVLAGALALALLAGSSAALLRGGDDLPLIVLGGGAGMAMGDASAAAGPMRSSEAGDVATSMWWTPTLYRFVLADGVTFPAGSGPAWRLLPPADLAAAAAGIATTLGLPAPVTPEWDADALQANGADGSSLWFSPSGDWYFSGPYDDSLNWICPDLPEPYLPEPILPEPDLSGPDPIVPELAGPDRSDAVDAVFECVPPPPLDGVPSEDRARSLATQLLATLGHPDARVTTVYRDDWSAWVSAELTVGGLPASSGLMVGIGFGAQERVTSAHGTVARVEPLGSYPTIDARAALLRLEADMASWMTVGPVARPYATPGDDGDTPVSDTPVTILPAPSDESTSGDGRPAPDGPAIGDVAPQGPEASEPVEVTVTIASVELITMMSWSPDGVVLLVPHYRLIDSDGSWWFVVAVEDRYLAG